MKHVYLVLFFAMFISTTFSQSVDTANVPVWIEMMQDPNANFFETQKAFERYWQGREQQKGDGWKVFKRWEWYWSQRIDEQGNMPAPDATLRAYEAWEIANNQQQSGTESVSGQWQEIGPRFKPFNGTGQPNGNGRLNYIEFHPSNPNILWVGSPSGGFWKTTNGGISWQTTTDNMPTLGVSSIVVDSSNTSTIYIGTGDRDAGDAPGLGVYKSTNGGNTFFASNTGMGNATVGEILMHPNNPSYLLAATSAGVYRSQNSGSTWTLESPNLNFKDIKFKPGDPNVVYATETSSTAGFWRSTNGGDTWSEVTTGLPSNGQRYAIGVSSAAPNTVYILCSISSAYGGLFRSTDAGLTFSTQSTTPNILTWSENPPATGGGGQGWYDLCIAVDPSNANTVYVGGVNIFKSTNAGVSWDCSAHWVGSATAASVHADHHWLEFSPVNGRLYNCNDGGLYYTANGGITWPETSDSLGISQIYKIGISQNTNELVINGYQDNGTAIWDNTLFRTERGGDGMECIIDYSTDNVMYATVYYGNIARSMDNGYSFGSFAAQNVNGITESGAWVAPFILDKDIPTTMFIGYKNVWRTTNTYAGSPTFTAISDNLAGSNNSNMRQLRQSKLNGNRLFALRSDNKLFRTDNALATTPTWVDLTSTLPSGWHISDVETSPQNNNRLWIIRNNVVYQSNDGGSSWININGNLPSINKNCMVADPYTNGGLYVGTDAGVYYKDNLMTNWVSFSTGLPASVEVTELEIFHVPGDWSARRLRAATYGRGLWESDLYDPGNRAAMAFGQSELNGVSTCDPGVFTLLSTSAYGVDSLSWNVTPLAGAQFINGTTANSNPAYLTFSEPGTYDVDLYVENAFGNDSESIINNFVVNTPAAILASNSINDEYCQGDTAMVFSNLGMTNYNFYLNSSWLQTGTNSSFVVVGVNPGDIVSVQITDPNGCVDDVSLPLNVWPTPTSVLTSNQGFDICEGDTVTLTNGGQNLMVHDFMVNSISVQSGALNAWTTSSLEDGDSIRVALTDSNTCMGQSNLVIMDVIPTPPTPSITVLTDTLLATGTGTIFQWRRNDTIAFVTTIFYPHPNDGVYQVRAYLGGCWSEWSEPLPLTGTGISSATARRITAYPSPTQDFLYLKVDGQSAFVAQQIELYDLLGKRVYVRNNQVLSPSESFAIDLSSLASGVYSLRIQGENTSISQSIIKEKQ